jgi:hypothetical protein
MFRVGVFALAMLLLSMFFGCSDETTDTEPTGVEVAFPSCLTFNAVVFIDGNYVGSYSSERSWFIDIAAGTHHLEAHSNLSVVDDDTGFCWDETFSVADGSTTLLSLPCDTAACPAE